MKYIDARTQESLKQGIMEFLNLSASEMIQIFMSIYEDTEKEPWEWVSDFLSDNMVDEVLEHIQMFHLSRRLEGTDPKKNNNLEQLLLEDSPLSNFFKKYKITFNRAKVILTCITRTNYNHLIMNLDMMVGMSAI